MDKIIETKKFDDECIINLWREAFGDPREDIEFFLDSCENKSVLCSYDLKGNLASMLFLVDCTLQGERYKYIYAACTGRAFRRQGEMTRLLDFAKECYSKIILIPADSDLAEYYRKRGFDKKTEISNIHFFEIEEIEEYLIDGCELEKPFALAYTAE